MCIKSRFILIIGIFLLLINRNFARHIVGGEIYYECIGMDPVNNRVTFQFTMNVYRDCFSTNSAELDPEAQIGFYVQNSSLNYVPYGTADVKLSSSRTLDPTNNNPCIIPPRVCVQEGVYTFTRTFDIINSSYVVVYQRCCRNNTISNILDPDKQGAAFYVEITPEAQRLCNSSPRFKNFPPIVICGGVLLNLDHGATDKENDLITYEFCAPFSAGGQNGSNGVGKIDDCNGVMPNRFNCPPPFKTVTFLSPTYTSNTPLAGNPVVKIDPSTGLITGIPEKIGQFVVGVCIKEYRSGVLLSVVRRDFQFNVAQCDIKVSARIQADSISKDQEFIVNTCGNNTVDFINQSIKKENIRSFDWFFRIGTDTIRGNTEHVKVTFPNIGTYRGQMILNKGVECSDTAFINVNVFPGINANFNYSYDTCIAGPVRFTNFSNSGSGNITNNDWLFEANGQSTLKDPSYIFKTPGNKAIRLEVRDINGCIDDTTAIIPYFPVPSLLVVDPGIFEGCEPLDVFFENLSIPIDSTYDITWDFGDGTFSDRISPNHTFQNKGLYSVRLSVTSPIGCHTEINYPDWITVKESPKAAFDYSPEILSSFNNKIAITDYSLRAKTVEYILSTGEKLRLRNPVYTFRDTGIYHIKQIAIHENGCIDTLLQILDIEPKVTFFMPNVFTPNGDGKNEEFLGKGATEFMQNFQMTIWDRWGGRLFTSKDPNLGWNGRFDNTGEFVPNGVYIYTLEYNTARKKHIELKGFATVLR